MRALRRLKLRVWGQDPDQFDEELERMDEAKRARDAERQEAEREARRRFLEMRYRARGGR